MTTFTFYGHTPPGIGEETTPGRLVVVEGTDGVGRSTQIAMLQEWLESEGYAVLVTGFRRSELAASGIDRAMRGNTLDALTLNLFYATDFWDRLEKNIVPALRTGMVALVDRYIFSIIARARVRGVPARWLNDVFDFALVPDLVLYLDVDVEHLLPRVLSVRQLDHWESGEDFLRGPDLYDNSRTGLAHPLSERAGIHNRRVPQPGQASQFRDRGWPGQRGRRFPSPENRGAESAPGDGRGR